MRDWIWIFIASLFLWAICGQVENIQQREQIIALQTDNATQGNMIRALEVNQIKTKLVLQDDFEEYSINQRQFEALVKRVRADNKRGHNPLGSNIPSGVIP